MDGYLFCERVAVAKEGRSPHLIAEMDHSYFVVGDHQFHQGYALVLLKDHVREPFDYRRTCSVSTFAKSCAQQRRSTGPSSPGR